MAKFTVDAKYLSHSDISDVEDTLLTIKSYEQETMGQGAQQTEKWVLYFREIKKGFGLNKTNGKMLCKLFGSDDMDDWIGQQIALHVKDDVEFQGETVSAIRVRTKLPGKKGDAPAEEDMSTLSFQEVIYRIDHAPTVSEIGKLMNHALTLDMGTEDMQALNVIKTQRIAALKAEHDANKAAK